MLSATVIKEGSHIWAGSVSQWEDSSFPWHEVRYFLFCHKDMKANGPAFTVYLTPFRSEREANSTLLSVLCEIKIQKSHTKSETLKYYWANVTFMKTFVTNISKVWKK